MPLVEVLATVNRFTHYVDELQHPSSATTMASHSEATIYAGIIGIGCAIGLRRMMRISHGINEEELEHAVNRHFTLDGLQAANDRVVRRMDRLELPNLGRRSPMAMSRLVPLLEFNLYALEANELSRSHRPFYRPAKLRFFLPARQSRIINSRSDPLFCLNVVFKMCSHEHINVRSLPETASMSPLRSGGSFSVCKCAQLIGHHLHAAA